MKHIIYLLTLYFNILYVVCVCSDEYGTINSKHRLEVTDGTSVIKSGSFNGCKNLKTVFLPDTVTTIEEYAFANSGIQRLLGAEGVQTLGNWSFANCSHLRIIDAENVTSWDFNAINNTNMFSSTFKPATFIYAIIQKDGVGIF
jgi:hypothetical protein